MAGETQKSMGGPREHPMPKLQSGLDAWRYVIETESRQNTVATYLPLILSAAGALGVLPFMVIRYLQGAWIAAIVDTVIVVGFACLGTYVYRTRRVAFASAAISVFCICGVMTTVYVIGPHQVFWTYPALMAVFYLVSPRVAITVAILTAVGLLPALLRAGDTHATITILITLAVMSSFAFAFSLITNRQREQLIRLATKDPLTGAGNRRSLEKKLADAVHTLDRHGVAASLVILDLDHFKLVNDAYGHAVGDQILQSVTQIINLRIRVTDSLYRIGGEEFVVVLDGQPLAQAEHLAEQLRTLVEANELAQDKSVTISLGVAELNAGESAQSWLHRADEALYSAKRAGRNLTRVAA